MILSKRPRAGTFPLALAAAFLISIGPLIGGCAKGNTEPSATPTPANQASATPVSTPLSTAAPSAASAEPGPAPGAATAQELQELVSPIALYPDVLVAQILAASTYPAQVVEAERWLKANPNVTGDQLAASVNSQPWDPSIKSLTQFPSVLQTMSESLAWTSALGEAYYNQPGDVMNAIQALRNMAVNAGNLKSTPQQTVEVQPAQSAAQSDGQPAVQQTVIIQPAQPNTVYVPQYNPTTAYGAPVQAPAGYSGTDLLLTGVLAFGAGILVGSLINDGHNNWGCNWGGSNSSVVYNKNIYVSNNNVLPARYPNYPNGNYPRPGYRPPNTYPRPVNPPRPMPYPGVPVNDRGIPVTRPYNPATAKPYAPGGNSSRPNFPKAETLPGNSGGAKIKSREAQRQRPAQSSNPIATTRPATSKPVNRVPNNPVNDPARGYAKDSGSRGGRNGALGGYEPGGSAQAASGRGRASVKSNPNFGGSRREAPNGGGNGGRQGGGGKRNGRKGQ
jgi:hypothetical protein